MNRLRLARQALAGLCTALTLASSHAAVQTLQLESGQQHSWTQAGNVTRAATGNPDVVGINVVPPKGVVITAKKPGTAMVTVWESGTHGAPAGQWQVLVTPSGIGGIVPSPSDNAAPQLSADGTHLRLSGVMSSLEGHAALENIARPLGGKAEDLVNTSTTGFDVQVQIDVKIVEVSRSKLKESGFYYQRHLSNSDGSWGGSVGMGGPSTYGGITRSGNETKFNLPSGGVPFTDAFNIFSISDNVWAAFSALEANGFAYSLAEPSLTALSGQTATFLAGGEIPIPFRSGADGAISVSFKEFGIRLGLTPTVLDKNRIALKVAPEVSEVDPSLAVQSGGFTIPGLRVRRTDTTVALGDGETFVISGLVSRHSVTAIDKFPFLGDLPVLGAFFRSNRFEREDKELLMIVRPHLVRPFAKEAKLPPLPGEDLRQYDPGYLRFLLLENGRAFQDSPESGFSN